MSSTQLIQSLFTSAKLWEAKSNIMTSVKWARQELHPWNNRCRKTWSFKQYTTFFPTGHHKEIVKSETRTVMIRNIMWETTIISWQNRHVHESTSKYHLNPTIISWWKWKWSWVETKHLHIIWRTTMICLSNCVSSYLPIYLSIYLSINLSNLN